MTIVERGNTARAWRAPWSVRIETRDGERMAARPYLIEGLTLAEALDELGIVLRRRADASVEIGCGNAVRARLEVHPLEIDGVHLGYFDDEQEA